MPIRRAAILKPEIEDKLKKELHTLWDAGFPARIIAEKLNFGVKGTDYEKLKRHHVWFYRSKFKFKKRRGGIKKGSSRYKVKHQEIMPFQKFASNLNEKVPKIPTSWVQRIRAYIILHYWTPLRKSEIIERKRKDFKIKGEVLIIDLYRKKKFYRPGTDTEPFYLSLKMPLVEEVVEWIEKFKPSERPFNFSKWTGWNYVKQVFEDYYPHFFRFSYITKAIENAEDAKTIIIELINDTGLDLSTITTYIMANPRHRTSINERELQKLRDEGIIK